jgi:two-component system cell cycle sensor histidine kinase/response regulator CckA
MIKQMLGRMGFGAVACTRPLTALEFFSRAPGRFHAVIVDEMMPDLRGIQLAAEILKLRDDVPIVLMTGHGHMITLEGLRESGVRATLIKPVLRERLKLVMDELLA